MRVSVSRALSGAAAALVCATALVAAPAAEAVQLRPAAVSASLDCYAEPLNNSLGLVSCPLTPSGVAPYSVSWSASGYASILSSSASELDLTCNRSGAQVWVTATVTDATGSVTTVSQNTSCITGTPR